MKKKLDLDTWVRKEHFLFFKQFDEPYYGVTVIMDCTAAYVFAKEKKASFFLYTMYLALAASQKIAEFTYRIEGDEVYIHDQVDGGSTVGRTNGTFGFGSFPYAPSFDEFIVAANQEVEQVQQSNELVRSSATNIIRFSSLPWIDFTSISHARMFGIEDSCPKISFGKMTIQEDGKRSMPVSIHVHHALVDGLHVGQFIDSFQQLMNNGA
ncbi:chloramphenicol acetyltransferase [Mucilaginibacter sp. OK283]|jgi:chloramphenicol O-acetyltransferase type A|uniref:chloramphenicol acetyltransferase n=1 Tax=Mucilaginibacter sp. OK283 TaxID=1881049 RepID=UPI0008B515BF|nr:chloramphenicol acetyltransferase [Mucilaginibacter sp. OK283]SEP13495.1 chloramphenicol O-acetyltransferase type A [Mucilaginibacter sp. OK283]